MNRSEVQRYESEFERLKRVDDRGEYWFARELMPYADYKDWRNFQNAINRAKTAMAGDPDRRYDVRDHFSVASPKIPDQGERGRGRPTGADYRLTRKAVYMIFMNGDPDKPAIAAAQNYFADKTRTLEIMEEQAPIQHLVPQTLQDALRAYADEIDAREKAELQAAEAKAEAEMLRPPAEAWNVLVEGADGDYSMAEAAAILNRDPAIQETGQNRLRDWMIRNRMMYRRGKGQLVPYHEHLPHIRLKPQTRPDHNDTENPYARKEANSQVRITAKGLSWIQQRMREEQKPELVPVPSPRQAPESSPVNLVQYRYERLKALNEIYGSGRR